MKNLQTIWGIVFLLLLSTACTKEVGYYQEEIPKGNVKMKNLTPLRVSDQMILEVVDILDTRCPVGEVCNSEGDVSIGFRVNFKGEFHELTVCFNELKKLEACSSIIDGHTIEVVNVTPYPYADIPIENISDYSIEVKVIKEK